MEKITAKLGEKLLKRKNRHRCWRRLVGVLASFVVFCTTYALILPAITMEKEVQCGKEEHQHEESCFTQILLCGEEETSDDVGEVPIHTEECYESILNCEIEEHTHGADCYLEEEPIGADTEETEESEETGRENSEIESGESDDADEENPTESDSAEREETDKSEEELTEDSGESGEESTENLEKAGEESGEEAEKTPEKAKSESGEFSQNTEEFSEKSGEISETGLKESILETSGETYRIQVLYSEDAGIPEGAWLKAEELDSGSNEYRAELTAVSEMLENREEYIYKASFFDISIMDEDTKIEPRSTVQVRIELTEEENADADELIVTHENEVLDDVDTTEENGSVTVLFETESFSYYGAIYKGESVTIGIGDTAELSGTESYTTDTWSVSQSGIIEIAGSGHTAEVTGKGAGTVTVTHTYTKKQGNKAKEQTEQFTVVVAESEDAVLTDKTSEYTVTVKGNKKVLADGIMLHVENYTDTEPDYQEYYDAVAADIGEQMSSVIAEGSFDFLHMYHIYLTKDGMEGEYVPEGNVNLQVTITYDRIPENWDKVGWVGHYRKVNGKVSREDISDGSSSASGMKQIRVSGNSITFHIKNFSVFPIAALSDSSGGSSTVITPIEPGDSGAYGDSLPQTAKNSWQIVSGGYTGNSVSDKTTASDNLVRAQKNVIPTDKENEFLIYLSVDKKVSWEEIIATSGLVVTSSGKYKTIGEIVYDISGNHSEISPIPPESATNQYMATVTLTRNGNVVDTITQTYYGTTPNCSNATGFLKLNIGGKISYVVASTSVNLHQSGSGSGGTLTYTVPLESLESKFDFADYTVGYDGVTDVMGDYISYSGTLGGDYSTAPSYDTDTKKLSWLPVQKSGRLPVYTDGTKVTGWYLNSAELVYQVTLDTAKDGFQSCAEYLKNGGIDRPYATNASASLSYHWSGERAGERSTEFSSPQVRGLLYDVIFRKVDADDSSKGVPGAVFTLTESDGKTVLRTVTTTPDTIQYEIASGLPCGSYILTETLPSGYAASEGTEWTVPLCYTAEQDSLVQCEAHGQNLRNSDSETGVLTIKNKKSEIKILLKKADVSTDAPLPGAEFEIYDENNILLSKGLTASGEDGVFSSEGFSLEPGIYYLRETLAPDGYLLPEGKFRLAVTSESVSVCSYDSDADGHYSASSAKNFAVQDGRAEVTLYNSAGIMLPATGGPGTLSYILSGLGLVLISCFMYGYRMRYKRERRRM